MKETDDPCPPTWVILADGHTHDWSQCFPAVNTPEWGVMNHRSAELIWRDVRGQITTPQREELELLQELVDQAIEAAFPFNSCVPDLSEPPALR